MRPLSVAVWCVALTAVHVAGQPVLTTDGDGNITLTAGAGGDVAAVVAAVGSGGTSRVSLSQLAADVQALQSTTALLLNATATFPTTAEVRGIS